VREWKVEWLSAADHRWANFSTGKSIGNKRIEIAAGAMAHNATAVRLTITSSVGEPTGVALGVFAPCSTGTPAAITKLGTEDIGMTETTPIVFEQQLYRFESVRGGNWNNTRADKQGYLRLRKQSGPPDWLTGDIATADFGVGWGLASAVVDGGGVYCFASKEKQEVAVFSSDVIDTRAVWQQQTAITLPKNYTIFNTAVAKGTLAAADGAASSVYAMALEVRCPITGSGFKLVFATATAIAGPYTLQHDTSHTMPDGLMFGPGSCPALRFDSATGYWHMLYTPNPTVSGGDYRTWQIWAARSKTLRYGEWELSPNNPVLEADAFDRQIHNHQIDLAQQGWAANTTNLNDSDADLVEYEGHVLMVLNWGDQRSTPTNSLAQAVFHGTLEEFWTSLYSQTPETR
jgi:hypothetical protein